GVPLPRVDPPDVAQGAGDAFCIRRGFVRARRLLAFFGPLPGFPWARAPAGVTDREEERRSLAAPGPTQCPGPLDPQGRRQGRDHGEAGLVLAQEDEFTGRRAFPRSASSSLARACFAGSPRR